MTGTDTRATRPATAVVLNMFYTGLGIARSLGARGVPVVGLSAQRGVYGNFTRHARVTLTADSRNEPERLLEQLLAMGPALGGRGILFPTRDHDLVFLDRFREQLEPYFSLVMPSRTSLHRCLNKWDTFLAARKADVPTPECWLVEDANDFARVVDQVTYPCVMKPLEAHHWRTAGNWALVGARKAVGIDSREQLMAEYATVARADGRVLIQQCIPGDDDCLVVTAAYVDATHTIRAWFNAQKLVQSPPGFGTGCIVRSASRPELLERTARLLAELEFSGIAEVEYKWDAAAREYKLIEVNPRPWDQHRIGHACGVDLMYAAYCDRAGLPVPDMTARPDEWKWIADDVLLMTVLRLAWRRDPSLRGVLRHARGRRLFGIWSASDPLPFAAYAAHAVPELWRSAWYAVRTLRGRAARPAGESAARVHP